LRVRMVTGLQIPGNSPPTPVSVSFPNREAVSKVCYRTILDKSCGDTVQAGTPVTVNEMGPAPATG